jgi:tryptophan synthase beta chain
VTEATTLPDTDGHFGPCGGRFVSETLFAALDEQRDTSELLWQSSEFQADFDLDMLHYVGRPSPLYHAKRLLDTYGGAQIYLKREDLSLWTPLF